MSDGAYARGASYLSQRKVTKLGWDSAENALYGRVQGSGGESYQTRAYFSGSGPANLRFDYGQCSCPVGGNCKHVVALVLTADEDDDSHGGSAGAGAGARTAPARPPDPRVAPGRGRQNPSPTAAPAAGAARSRIRPEPPVWQASLGELLGAGTAGPATPDAAGRWQPRTGTEPLGIELSLDANSPRPGGPQQGMRVTARLVRPGRNGWVGALTWDELAGAHRSYEFLPQHVRVLQELYALYRVGRGYGYYSSSSGLRHVDLSTFESHQLWPMLDEAAAVGVRIVHSRRKLGDVGPPGAAELVIDVDRDAGSGGLVVRPRVRLLDGPDADVAPFAFVGNEGHGVVYVDRAEIRASDDHRAWRIRLARLVKPVPPQLRRMAVGGGDLLVPARDESRFLSDYFPRLRRLAPVVSSTGSVALPEPSPPTLVLAATFGDDHQLDLAWEWEYDVGGRRLRVPLLAAQEAAEFGTHPADFRDAAEERDVLAGLDLPDSVRMFLPADQPTGAAGPGGVARRLSGTETMWAATELLPSLADRAGVTVEVHGEPSDYREVGDSLRIGVSADDVAGDNDWFDLGVRITVAGGREVPFTDVFLALSRGEQHLLLADGTYFRLDRPDLVALRRLIDEADALCDGPVGELRISRFQVGFWDELASLGVVERQAQAWREQVTGLLELTALDDQLEPPASLAARLRPYQLDGFRWLAFLRRHRLGGILADDMGLGKTIQALALACHAKQDESADGPLLVVAPTSVVPNWAAEAARFAPGLRVVAIFDTERRRGEPLATAVAGADLVVTSYTLFRLEFDDYAGLSWDGLVLDEAQAVKNHQSKAYRCARLLPARFKLAVTGTPMENNLMELWSLLSITAPGLFPSPSKFRDFYLQPITNDLDGELLAQFRRRVKPLLLRRTKEQVAPELPAKQEQVLEVELHPRHRRLYQTQLQRERQKVLGLVDDMNRNRFTILQSLTLMRQLSLHAGLVDKAHEDIPSAKIDVLLEQLSDVVNGGHRALVFSQFTRFLGRVSERLAAAGLEHCYLDGQTKDRAAVVDRFRSGAAPVFLISLKAGGFGLNLTEADYCFLLDPWWNPATEAQAVDRAHRIGQTRAVMVYRLVARDTVEEKVMAMKERKAELFASVMDEGNIFGSALAAADVRQLFA